MSAKIFVVSVPSLSKKNGQMAEFGEELTKEHVDNFEELSKADFLLSREDFDKKFNAPAKAEEAKPETKIKEVQKTQENN